MTEISVHTFGDPRGTGPQEESFDAVCNIEVSSSQGPVKPRGDCKLDVTFFPDERMTSFHFRLEEEGDWLKGLISFIAQNIDRRRATILREIILMPSPNDGSRINMRGFGNLRPGEFATTGLV